VTPAGHGYTQGGCGHLRHPRGHVRGPVQSSSPSSSPTPEPLAVWTIQLLPLPWAVVLGQILLGLLVLGHGRVHRGHGLIHISHECLLILVFPRFPPFARVH
jgi:hypothetical protein